MTASSPLVELPLPLDQKQNKKQQQFLSKMGENYS